MFPHRRKVLILKEIINIIWLLARFVVVCGDGEYIIYTAMALRNKSFGSAQEFCWSHDSSVYCIRESNSMVKIFKNFKEQKSFKPDFGAEGDNLIENCLIICFKVECYTDSSILFFTFIFHLKISVAI